MLLSLCTLHIAQQCLLRETSHMSNVEHTYTSDTDLEVKSFESGLNYRKYLTIVSPNEMSSKIDSGGDVDDLFAFRGSADSSDASKSIVYNPSFRGGGGKPSRW